MGLRVMAKRGVYYGYTPLFNICYNPFLRMFVLIPILDFVLDSYLV